MSFAAPSRLGDGKTQEIATSRRPDQSVRRVEMEKPLIPTGSGFRLSSNESRSSANGISKLSNMNSRTSDAFVKKSAGSKHLRSSLGSVIKSMLPPSRRIERQQIPALEHTFSGAFTMKIQETTRSSPKFLEITKLQGRSFSPDNRRFFEQRFGQDFSHVQLHTDTNAAESAKSLDARAYTIGNHIVFDSGEYRPNDPVGQKLIAHELTHILQQSKESVLTESSSISDTSSPAEQEARAWAEHFERGKVPFPNRVSAHPQPGIVYRQPAPGSKGGSQAGFGKEPSYRSLLVTIVGHASPRWKGVSSKEKADRLNEKLSKERSEAVRDEIEWLIHQQLGQNVKIEFDISRPEGEEPDDIGINTSGVGSRDTLTESGGDRNRNDEISRRVEVAMEMLTTKYHEVGKSIPPKKILSYTKFWDVRIKRLLVSGIVIPGPAGGWVELIIRNPISGKEMLFRAALYGGGDPMPQDTPDKYVGNMRTFEMDEKMGFDDFKGEYVRIERMDLQAVVGVTRYYLSFPNRGSGAFAYLGQKFGFGFPGGYIVSGSLKMVGTNPDEINDYYEDKSSPTTETSVTATKSKWSEGLILTFPTGSSVLSPTENKRLKQFVEIWLRRY